MKKKYKDIAGKRFKKLVAIKYIETIKGNAIWLCQCDCGNTTKTKTVYLNNGDTKSCGCLNKDKGFYTDLTGDRYGKITVLSFSHRDNYSYWNCRCDCGREMKMISNNFIRRKNVACRNCTNVTHNMSKSKEYKSYTHMKERCYKPNTKGYENYGGRGIKICDRWLDSFEFFLADMGKKPQGGVWTIERVNNNGNYEPSNCIWLPLEEQAKNRRPQKVLR